MKSSTQVDEYIQKYPQSVQLQLQKVRETIRSAAPNAEEAMAYGIPTYKLNGNLIHFGASKSHIGLYPGSEAIDEFKSNLSNLELSKGTIRFLLTEPIPFDSISKITQYRVSVNQAKKKP